jgi:hypothetical protein
LPFFFFHIFLFDCLAAIARRFRFSRQAAAVFTPCRHADGAAPPAHARQRAAAWPKWPPPDIFMRAWPLTSIRCGYVRAAFADFRAFRAERLFADVTRRASQIAATPPCQTITERFAVSLLRHADIDFRAAGRDATRRFFDIASM